MNASSPGGAARDPGLQPERTRLAWRRTTLSATVVAVLATKQAARDGATGTGLLGAALSALAWVGFLVVAHGRMRELGEVRPAGLGAGRAWVVVGCGVALAGFGVVVVW